MLTFGNTISITVLSGGNGASQRKGNELEKLTKSEQTIISELTEYKYIQVDTARLIQAAIKLEKKGFLKITRKYEQEYRLGGHYSKKRSTLTYSLQIIA